MDGEILISDSEDHHWLGAPLDPENQIGFVYAVVNKADASLYIGKKLFWSTRRVKVKGRKNRKVRRSNNKWEYYTGSSKRLNADIAELGSDQFVFVAIEAFTSKGDLHYAEIELQVMLGAVPDARFYNGNVAACKFYPAGKETRLPTEGRKADTADELIAEEVIVRAMLVRKCCHEAVQLMFEKVGRLA